MNERASGGFLLGFVFGAMVGASIAVLITPEGAQGQEMVRDLYAQGKRMIDGARADLDAALSEGRTAAQERRETLERLES